MDLVSVYVTCPDEASAERIARGLLDLRLIACANIIPGARSLYWWEGRVQDEREVVMFMKTRRALVHDVLREARALHPYDVPCIVALEISAGDKDHLSYVGEVTKG